MNNLKLNLVNGAIVSAITVALITLPLTIAHLASTPTTQQNVFTAVQATSSPVIR